MLELSIEKGYRGFAWPPRRDWRFFAYHDIAVDSIRDDPRFRSTIAVIEADMAQQLENVREMGRRGDLPTLAEVEAIVASKEEGG